MSVFTQKRYRLLMAMIFVGLLVLGVGLIVLTNTFIRALQTSSQPSPDQAHFNEDFLILGITMLAGLPAIAIGTYLAHLGHTIRNTSPSVRGPVLMVGGGFIILCSLVLPLVVWWMSESL